MKQQAGTFCGWGHCFMIIGALLTSSLQAVRVTPAVVEVPIVQQEESVIELGTDLADGMSWEATSDQPFVSIETPTGTAPGKIKLRVDQAALGTFLAGQDQWTAATVTVRSGGDVTTVPVRLEENPYHPDEFFHSGDPEAIHFYHFGGGGASHLVRMLVPSGLISAVVEVDGSDLVRRLHFDLQGGRIFLRNENPSEVSRLTYAVFDAETLVKEKNLALPPDTGLVAAGNGFLLLSAGRESGIAGVGGVGDLVTYDEANESVIAVLKDKRGGSLRSLGLKVLRYQAEEGGGNEILLADITPQDPGNYEIYRIERNRVTLETSNPHFDTITGQGSFGGGEAFVSRDGERIFAGEVAIERRTGNIVNVIESVEGATGLVDVDRSGQIALTWSDLSYVDSGVVIEDPRLGTFSGFDPGFFSNDDRYLIRYFPGAAKELRIFELASLAQVPVPIPAPGQRLSDDTPWFSVPAVAGASSYRLQVRHPFNGVSVELESDTPEFQLVDPLPRGYRYQWQIDVVTPDKVVPGIPNFFEVRIAVADTLPFGLSGASDDLLVSAIGSRSAQLAEVTSGNRFSSATRLATFGEEADRIFGQPSARAGGKLYLKDAGNNGGVLIYKEEADHTLAFAGRVPNPRGDPGTFFGSILRASGDLLFVATAAGPRENPVVEVYRTRPRTIHETTIALPDFGDDPFVALNEMDLQVSGDVLTVTLRRLDDQNEVIPILLVYHRLPGTGEWQLDQTVMGAAQNKFWTSCDGRRLAVLEQNLQHGRFGFDQSTLTIYERDSDDLWSTVDRLGSDSGELPTHLISQPILIRNSVITLLDRRGLLLIREHEGEWFPSATLDDPLLRKRSSLVREVNGNLLSQFDSANGRITTLTPGVFPTDGEPSFLSRLPTQALAGALFESVVLIEGDSLVLESGPGWLSLESLGDGAYRLFGQAPAATEVNTVRLRAEGAEGRAAFQVLDLEVMVNPTPIEISLSDSADPEVIEGDTITLTALVEGEEPLHLQWLKDGEPIEGETFPALDLVGTAAIHGSVFSLRVTNVGGTVTSDPIRVETIPATRFGTAWTMERADKGGRNFIPAALGSGNVIPTWSKKLAATSSVLSGGKVYLSGVDSTNDVLSLSLENGDELWRFSGNRNEVSTPPALSRSGLHVTVQNTTSTLARAIALDRSDGQVLWSNSLASGSRGFPTVDAYHPVVAGERVWFPVGEQGLQSWELDGRNFRRLTPIDPGALSLFSGDLGYVVLDDFETVSPFTLDGIALGRSHDFRTTVGDLRRKPAAIDGSRLFVCGDEGIEAINVVSRRRLWSASPLLHPGQISGEYEELAVSGSHLAVANVSTDPDEDPVTGEFISHALVEVFDPGSGEKLAVLPPLESRSESPRPVAIDLLLLNDKLITSALGVTRIFDLETFELTGEIPVSGDLIFGEGHLLIRHPGDDGSPASLNSYRFNTMPVLTLGDQSYQEDDPAVRINLIEFAFDEETEAGDLVFSIEEDGSGGIATVSLEDDSLLQIVPEQDQFGTFELAIRVADEDGGEATRQITVEIVSVNDSPVFSGNRPFLVTAPEDGSAQAVDFGPLVSDVDIGDRLTYTIAEDPDAAVLAQVSVGPATGVLAIEYALYRSGEVDLEIVATDLAGEAVTIPVHISVPPLPEPKLIPAGQGGVKDSISLNPQTGLFEQRLTITNEAARAIGGFTLSIRGLTDGYEVYQNEAGEIVYGSPMGAGESVTMVLEYYSQISGKVPTPELEVATILPEPLVEAGELGVGIEKVKRLEDGSILLEFPSDAGARYLIQYSLEMNKWFNSPVPVNGKNGTTQWLDQGLPRTNCHPSECPSRFYRVLKIETEG